MADDPKAQARRHTKSLKARSRATAPVAERRARSVKGGFGDRARYRFDNTLSRGPLVVVLYLGLLTLAVIVIAAVVAALARLTFGGGTGDGFDEDLWQALLRTLDSGTFAADTDWPTRLVGLAITLLGIFLAGSLIGLIANDVDQRVERLRRGRTAVIEAGHTLILGWSAQVPRIIGELVIANESERDACVVVLADIDKVTAEQAIRALVPDLRTTRVVCRTGDVASPDDLARAAIGTARSVVAVRSGSDAAVIRSALAVRVALGGFPEQPMVAELTDAGNARTLEAVSGGGVLTVSSDGVVAHVTAQACQQPGLAAVFTDLLDFDGDEIYFAPVGALAGRTYRDSLLAYEACSVIGRQGADGAIALNCPVDTVLAHDDELIVVAADDSTVVQTGVVDVEPAAGGSGRRPDRTPSRVLLLGWSEFGERVLRELDALFTPGSSVVVDVDHRLVDVDAVRAVELANATLTVVGGTGAPEELLSTTSLDGFDQVVVLGYRDALDPDEADARTMLTLLALRQVWPDPATSSVRLVAELLDQRNVEIAAPVGVDDLVVSEALGSLLMAQLAERFELHAVFEELFAPAGASVELVPAAALTGAAPTSWASVVAAGADQRMTAIGWFSATDKKVRLNPPKSSSVQLGRDDRVVVVADRFAART